MSERAITKPQRGNPFDQRFRSELREVAINCDKYPSLRATLTREQGKYFSVGADPRPKQAPVS